MKLTLIAESPNHRPVQKFLASLGAEDFRCGPTYCCCILKTTIADLKSKVFPSIEDLEWYPKAVSNRHSAGFYLCFAPIVGEEVSTGPYVWHAPGRRRQDVAEQVELIKQNGLEPRSFSGKSGGMWNHYPPRIFVFLRPEGIHTSGIENIPIAQIDSAGKTFYHDEQFARGHAAYTIDPIPPEDITWVRAGDKLGEVLPWEDQDISGGWAAGRGFGA